MLHLFFNRSAHSAGLRSENHCEKCCVSCRIYFIVSVALVALLGYWVEKLCCSAFPWLRRFRVVGFRIVGVLGMCVAGGRLRPLGFKAGASAIFEDFWEISGRLL